MHERRKREREERVKNASSVFAHDPRMKIREIFCVEEKRRGRFGRDGGGWVEAVCKNVFNISLRKVLKTFLEYLVCRSCWGGVDGWHRSG